MSDLLNQNKNRPRIDLKLIFGLLGGLIFFFGLALLLPLGIALLYEEPSWSAFFISSGISVAGGIGLFYTCRPNEELRIREAFLIVTLTWFTGALIGAFPFYLSGVLETFSDSFFESMSGLTTTGATILGGVTSDGIQNPAIEDIDKSLLFWRSLLHWLGGMGIIVLTLALLPLLGIGGMQLYKAEYSGTASDKITPRVQNTAKLLWSIYVGFTALQAVLLWLHPSMDWFEAVNHAFSTMATGGFSTKNLSIAAFDSVYIDVVIIIFMFLAGINFAMHFKLFSGDFTSFFSDREIRFYTFLTALFILLISGSLWFSSTYSAGEALRYGSFQVISILTTTGFGTDDYTLWMPFTSFLLFLLFFTGGCAGSTGGGIKIMRILIILKNVVSEIKQTVHPQAVIPLRIGNKVVDQSILRTILGFFVMYLIVFLTGTLIMTYFGFDFLSATGASIASLGNIGPAWGQFGPVNEYAGVPYTGKWILSFLMLIGRLELFTVLILFSSYFWKH